VSTAAELPTGLDGGQSKELPEAYRTLIAHGQAHGVIGRPGSRQANAHRDQLGLPAQRGNAAWTAVRLERWRDRSVDWLDTHLLREGSAPTTPTDQARAVLALADVAVRDTWLIRFARASHDAQEQAANRLAAIAPSAPDSLRPPVGTVLALAEWTVGRDDVRERLDWATLHGAADYRLAQLTRALLDADVPPSVFTQSIAGVLTEQECRHPEAVVQRSTPEDAGKALAAQGWALRVETQVDLPSGVAWSGTLAHRSHPVASVCRNDPALPPVLYFPPGSREQATWESAIRDTGVTLTDAIAGLDHVATFGRGQAAARQDPLGIPPANTAEVKVGEAGRGR
jgi:hypothetical protein